jgi:hypothetical protein
VAWRGGNDAQARAVLRQVVGFVDE